MTVRVRDESGFTATEVVMTSFLLAFITVSLLGVLVSQTKAERRASAVVNSQEDVRFAMTALARDLRSADPLVSPTSITTAPYEVDLQLGDTGSGPSSTVRWSLDAAHGKLLRQTLSGPGGSVTGTTFTLNRVHNGDGAGTPMFTFWNSTSSEMTASNSTAADIANCTIRVHIRVTADTNPGPAPFTVESDAELRNRLPGGIGC